MGFSVSGSFAVIAIGTFIAVGMFYGAASNGAEKVTESQSDAFDDRLEQQNTAINITKVSNKTTTPPVLVIEVENTGSTALKVNTTNYIIDNTVVTHSEIASDGNSFEQVDGDASTDLWLPNETLTAEISADVVAHPDQVRIVTGPGVADTKEVTDV